MINLKEGQEENEEEINLLALATIRGYDMDINLEHSPCTIGKGVKNSTRILTCNQNI